jgi:hypothetical protein
VTFNVIGAGIAALMIVVVALKVFVDREMKVSEAVPIAILFAIWGAVQWRGSSPGGSPIILIVAFVLLARVYGRNAPRYRQRFHQRLAEIQSRNRQRHN